MGIHRTYMAVTSLHLNNEMLILFEQLARLLRDCIHYTCIRKMTPDNIYFNPPTYSIDNNLFTDVMEEKRKILTLRIIELTDLRLCSIKKKFSRTIGHSILCWQENLPMEHSDG